MLKAIGIGLGILTIYVFYKLGTADGTKTVAPPKTGPGPTPTTAPPKKAPASGSGSGSAGADTTGATDENAVALRAEQKAFHPGYVPTENILVLNHGLKGLTEDYRPHAIFLMDGTNRYFTFFDGPPRPVERNVFDKWVLS